MSNLQKTLTEYKLLSSNFRNYKTAKNNLYFDNTVIIKNNKELDRNRIFLLYSLHKYSPVKHPVQNQNIVDLHVLILANIIYQNLHGRGILIQIPNLFTKTIIDKPTNPTNTIKFSEIDKFVNAISICDKMIIRSIVSQYTIETLAEQCVDQVIHKFNISRFIDKSPFNISTRDNTVSQSSKIEQEHKTASKSITTEMAIIYSISIYLYIDILRQLIKKKQDLADKQDSGGKQDSGIQTSSKDILFTIFVKTYMDILNTQCPISCLPLGPVCPLGPVSPPLITTNNRQENDIYIMGTIYLKYIASTFNLLNTVPKLI